MTVKNRKMLLTILAAVFTLALLLPGCSKPAPTLSPELETLLNKASGIGDIYYEVATSLTGTDETMSLKVWIKAPKVKVHTVLFGQETVLFADMETKTGYVYLPEQNLANRTDFDQIPDSAQMDMESIRKYGPVIAGKETLDGKSCTVVTYREGKSDVKVWLWDDYGLPLRRESVNSGKLLVVEIKNIDFSPIPDSVFELPDDVLRSDWFETPAE